MFVNCVIREWPLIPGRGVRPRRRGPKAIRPLCLSSNKRTTAGRGDLKGFDYVAYGTPITTRC